MNNDEECQHVWTVVQARHEMEKMGFVTTLTLACRLCPSMQEVRGPYSAMANAYTEEAIPEPLLARMQTRDAGAA